MGNISSRLNLVLLSKRILTSEGYPSYFAILISIIQNSLPNFFFQNFLTCLGPMPFHSRPDMHRQIFLLQVYIERTTNANLCFCSHSIQLIRIAKRLRPGWFAPTLLQAYSFLAELCINSSFFFFPAGEKRKKNQCKSSAKKNKSFDFKQNLNLFLSLSLFCFETRQSFKPCLKSK